MFSHIFLQGFSFDFTAGETSDIFEVKKAYVVGGFHITLTASIALFMSSKAACLFLSVSLFKVSQPRRVPTPPDVLDRRSKSSIALFSRLESIIDCKYQ